MTMTGSDVVFKGLFAGKTDIATLMNSDSLIVYCLWVKF